MRTSIKLTKRQAKHLADKTLAAGFFVAGLGHFDLNDVEMCELFMILFNGDTQDAMDFYEKIRR